jgi:hypothetical protein
MEVYKKNLLECPLALQRTSNKSHNMSFSSKNPISQQAYNNT